MKYTTSTRKIIKDDPIYCCISYGSMGFREKTKGVKALNGFGNGTILEHQLTVLRHTIPNSYISITTGFQSERIVKVRPENVAIIENRLYEEENIGEEIRLLLNVINPTKLLLIDGAVIFDEFSIRKLIEGSSIFSYNNDDVNEVGIQVENGKVVHFSYGLKEKWAGLVYLEGNDLEVFKKVVNRENSKLLLHELLNITLDRKVELKVINYSKSKIVRF